MLIIHCPTKNAEKRCTLKRLSEVDYYEAWNWGIYEFQEVVRTFERLAREGFIGYRERANKKFRNWG